MSWMNHEEMNGKSEATEIFPSFSQLTLNKFNDYDEHEDFYRSCSYELFFYFIH